MIANCGNTSNNIKKTGVSVKFHPFPKDLERQEKWVYLCNQPNTFNPATRRVCSAHFKDSDFERDLQNELLGLPVKRILSKTAVPSIGVGDKGVELALLGLPVKRNLSKTVVPSIGVGDKGVELDEWELDEGTQPITVEQSITEDEAVNNYLEMIDAFQNLKQEFALYKVESTKKITNLQRLVCYYRKRIREQSERTQL